MNQQAAVFLRVNTLKTSIASLKEALKQEQIETNELNGFQTALQLLKRDNVFQTKGFKEGWFEVQDAGSQLISEFLDPGPNDLVIDACAGAGGKSLHMAALMKNKGKIISLDIEDWKLQELKKRAKRAGAFNIEARNIEEGKTVKQLYHKADKLLLDVPCSGLGVLKRNPDTKWKLNAENLRQTKELQQNILTNYSEMLKPGGTLVYSTCSLLPSENRAQADAFLSKNKHFEFVKDKNILPSEGYDGFYMALLKKSKSVS
jgi:16S rRNA (cytosine967-C5)-methyltransferase